ncbi:hypothetical protein DQ384_12520 [Sphaerisporangium album]|uniref:Uncharacterized protein n=1 Tax=Sphaerisporangium album TaxID=509200 RepID=A0A367FKI0_9ACTN|nr:hypothetical protein [Sphaerisporangium album]RCG30804.1 hypothetical protein DQ384_12520 [Sphaerisporangium album]
MSGYEVHSVHRDDDGALLGYVRPVADGLWEPQTVFGSPLAAARSEEEARDEVRRNGLEFLIGDWWFRAPEDGAWYRCVILEAELGRVRVHPRDHGYPGTAYALTIDRPVADLRKTPPSQGGDAMPGRADEDPTGARPLG